MEREMSKSDRAIEKIQWMWNILRSKSYMIITDKGAVYCMPYFNIQEMGAMNNVLLLTAQRESLVNFRSQIELLINQHDQVTKGMMYKRRRENRKTKRN